MYRGRNISPWLWFELTANAKGKVFEALLAVDGEARVGGALTPATSALEFRTTANGPLRALPEVHYSRNTQLR